MGNAGERSVCVCVRLGMVMRFLMLASMGRRRMMTSEMCVGGSNVSISCAVRYSGLLRRPRSKKLIVVVSESMLG